MYLKIEQVLFNYTRDIDCIDHLVYTKVSRFNLAHSLKKKNCR